jgi:hypothetical protein
MGAIPGLHEEAICGPSPLGKNDKKPAHRDPIAPRRVADTILREVESIIRVPRYS